MRHGDWFRTSSDVRCGVGRNFEEYLTRTVACTYFMRDFIGTDTQVMSYSSEWDPKSLRCRVSGQSRPVHHD